MSSYGSFGKGRQGQDKERYVLNAMDPQDYDMIIPIIPIFVVSIVETYDTVNTYTTTVDKMALVERSGTLLTEEPTA